MSGDKIRTTNRSPKEHSRCSNYPAVINHANHKQILKLSLNREKAHKRGAVVYAILALSV